MLHLNLPARGFGMIGGAWCVVVLAACSAQDSASVVATNEITDTIAVSPTISVAAVVGGGRQTVSLGFNPTGTTTLTDLTVTSGLSSLPAGWSGPSTFSCGSVSTGSGCLLNLAFAPTAAASGTITITYSYKNSAGATQTGTTTVNYTGTTNNNVIGTAAPAGQITATVGQGSQSVAVTFTTDDGNPATALVLSTDLTTLPAGWTSTAKTFTCATLSTGNGCQLPLTYAPPAGESGTLTLTYTYKDNSGDPKTGTVSIPYAGTTNDSVVGTVAPSGQVVSVLGSGTQAVTIAFTTDDGNPATAITLTSNLANLPAGWSSTASGFTCASVSTGNGCQLPLIFQPTTVGSGTLSLTYTYTNDAGEIKTGTVNISYAGTVHDNVVGTASPSGQVNAVVAAGTQTAVVTFDTDDGNLASAFSLTTNLNTLPSGWTSSVHTFTCAQVSTGSSCQLTLAYAPTAAATGTLSLGFSYTDNAGTAKTGTVSIPYAATVHDTVVGTTSPSGQISEPIGNAPQPVNVTFTTDDGNPASGLSITSGLSSLPLGWSSSASSFNCTTVSTGTGCQLNLSFTATATATGTLALGYAYTDNAGTPKTGTVDIAYVSTSHNTVIGNSGGTIRVKVGSTRQTQVIFTTNDGNTATNFQITSDLSTLPAGWSGTNGFTCSSVNSGTGCALTLTYAPISNATGSFTLDFSYTDSAFTNQTGSVNVVYSNPHLYQTSTGLTFCQINLDGTLGTCTATGGGLANNGYGYGAIGFSSSYAYYPDYQNGEIFVCNFLPDGSVSGCTVAYAPAQNPSFYTAAINGDFLYVSSENGVQWCTIGALGALSNCSSILTNVGNYSDGMAFVNGYAYLGNYGSGVDRCTVAVDGSLGNCALVNTTTFSTQVSAVSASNGYLYVANNNVVTSCQINQDGSLSACANYTVYGSGDYWYGIAVLNGDLYVSGYPAGPGTIYHCDVNASSGVVSNCVEVGSTGGDITLE